MSSFRELARFTTIPSENERVGLDQKVQQSLALLAQFTTDDPSITSDFNIDSFRQGAVPRLSPFDLPHIPEGAKLVKIPDDLVRTLRVERSYDLIRWNRPDRFLFRLQLGQQKFEPPVPGRSRVMDRLAAEGKVVSFDDLKVSPPEPNNGRKSRKRIDQGIESPIMGYARIPFALGSVPDVGSALAYITIAQANAMAFISRDKLLSDQRQQVLLAKEVIDYLKTAELPSELHPNNEQLAEFAKIMGIVHGDPNAPFDYERLKLEYINTLRNSWVANIGAAIEADAEGDNGSRALKRAEELYETGCRMFRIYSPEGGMEIVDTAKALRRMFQWDNSVTIVGGQIMDAKTALRAEHAGCDALFIGVAGGSQCTTSVNANIPVNTPNLLYDLRRGEISIPVGIEGGGVGENIVTAFALGASFVSKPGELGRSWEGLGGKYVFEGPDGNYYMVYGGEASVSAKWFKDSLDVIGRPQFVEGETGVRELNRNQLSMTRTIHRLRGQLAIGLVFQRAESIAELHSRSADNIVEVTQAARALSQAYGI